MMLASEWYYIVGVTGCCHAAGMLCFMVRSCLDHAHDTVVCIPPCMFHPSCSPFGSCPQDVCGWCVPNPE